jgi:hypothetical protein
MTPAPQPEPLPDVIVAAMRLANLIYLQAFGFKPYPPPVTK